MKIGKKAKKIGKKIGKKAKKIGKTALKTVKPAASILGGGPLQQIAKPAMGQFLGQIGVPGASQLTSLV